MIRHFGTEQMETLHLGTLQMGTEQMGKDVRPKMANYQKNFPYNFFKKMLFLY